MNHFDRAITPPAFTPGADTREGAPHPYAPMGEERTSFGETLRAVRRHRKALAAWVALCLVGMGLYLIVTPPSYLAAAQVLLETRRPLTSSSEAGASVPPPALDSAQAESQIHVVQSERVLKYVFDTLDLADNPAFADTSGGFKAHAVEAFQRLFGRKATSADDRGLRPDTARARAFTAFSDRVDVRRIGQSYVLEIGFSAGGPEDAARYANAIASAYLRDQVVTRAADAQRGIEYLQGRIALIKSEQDAADAAIRAGTVPEMQFPDSDARVISAALPPLAPAAPKRGLMMVFAAVLGLASGLGVVALRHSFDRTVRRGEQIWPALRLDCLGTLSALPGRRRVGLDAAITHPESDLAAQVRVVRTALLSKLPKAKPSAIGVVACGTGGGATTVAANLAHLLAASGQPMVLVDADFERPLVSRVLGEGAPAGLAALLAAGSVSAPLPILQLWPGMNVLPAMAPGQNREPHLFVGSATMQAIVSSLCDEHGVVVDLPSLDRSYDAQAIGPLLDGLVLVVEAGRTALDDLRAAARTLTSGGATVLGVVVNKVEPARR